MFRGRKGYDSVGNKTLREKAAIHRRMIQLERLNKINTRKPGTSLATLNNLPPVGKLSTLKNSHIFGIISLTLFYKVIKAFFTNPRKREIKEEFNQLVEQDNK